MEVWRRREGHQPHIAARRRSYVQAWVPFWARPASSTGPAKECHADCQTAPLPRLQVSSGACNCGLSVQRCNVHMIAGQNKRVCTFDRCRPPPSQVFLDCNRLSLRLPLLPCPCKLFILPARFSSCNKPS
jgi:hypothetical protein